MITKHRNRSIVQFVCALAMTGLLAYMLYAVGGILKGSVDNWMALGVFLYFGTVTMWGMASFSFAKAKGYSSDQIGAILIFLWVVSYCMPLATFILPAVVIGLKDKTRERRRY